jgi:sugar lactone lactonase YvrE
MIEYTEGNAQFADTADVQWHTGVDLATYSNKIYLLDAVSKQIWKYQRGNTGYTGASTYFSEAPDVLADAVSIAVDGRVWVLLKDGTLLQYFASDPVEYIIKKAPLAKFEGATRVYTDGDMTQLYILDAAAKRIFVYDKSQKTDDLTYSSQYALDALSGPITDMMVDKTNHTVYLTTETGIYQMNFTADL